MDILICVLLGYLIGSFNPSYLLARKRGVDIRSHGSGNAGASNALILFGKLRGAICALLDIGKACVALWLTATLLPQCRWAYCVTAVACVLGHIFPFYMGFRGGKGLACLGGVILYFDRRVFFAMLLAEILIVLITDYICFVPLTASVAFPVIYGLMEKDWAGGVVLLVMTAAMVGKHVENLRRIAQGKEVHLSFLWKPEEELERVKEKWVE